MQKIEVVLAVLVVLLIGNVAFLNYKVLYDAGDKEAEEHNDSDFNIVDLASPSAEQIDKLQGKTIDSCSPYSCVDLIRQATESLSPKTATSKSTAGLSTGSAKEFYVTFGSGQTLSDEWEDIPGLSAYIDSTKYSKIKTVTFEASMRIPTANGRVYAQLFDDTDKHAIWFSEVSMEGNKSQLVISSPIQLDLGNKLYKVQMKTTLKFLSILDQARMHIITE